MSAAHFHQALDKLKLHGVRMTPQRYAILQHLVHTMSHPTADEIYRALESQFPSMSVATVYNNLRVFMEAGLVKEMTFGDSSSRYDADMSDHYHVNCNVCGKVVDFEHPPLHEAELAAAAATGFRIEGHRLEFYGTCPECLEHPSRNVKH